jgi:hypothetical protein
MRIYLFNIIGLLIIVNLFSAQAIAQGKLVFEKNKHDFGQIQEEDGPAEVTFEFTNTGSTPVTISNVKASCGCTTPTWTKEAVTPGKTGIITASYNPSNRPGPFNKSITVTSDASNSTAVLIINGDVIPRERGPQDWFPIESGALRMRARNVYFNQVYNDDTNSTVDFLLYNQSEKPINLKLAETMATFPPHISMVASQTQINPRDSLILQFKYDAVKKNDWGYMSDRFILMTNDTLEPNKQMYISANIVENFGNLTSESKIPMISFDKTYHDFGKINQGTTSSIDFKMTNNGNAPLIIRKTSASCGCTASEPKKTELAPGESTMITVRFNSSGKTGKQDQNVTIITNDPAQTSVRLNIAAEINP